MPRPPGLPKTGGRKKGSPNKRTTDLLEALNLNCIDVLGEIAKLLPRLPEEKHADVLMGFMPYLYPKRKSVEMEISEKAVPQQGRTMKKVRQIHSDPLAKRLSLELAERLLELEEKEIAALGTSKK